MAPLDPLRYRLLPLPLLPDPLVVVRAPMPHLDHPLRVDRPHAELVSAPVHQSPRVPPARDLPEERDGLVGKAPGHEQRGPGRGGAKDEELVVQELLVLVEAVLAAVYGFGGWGGAHGAPCCAEELVLQEGACPGLFDARAGTLGVLRDGVD